MTDLELKIYQIVRTIPEGKVATYGQIAAVAGDSHLSRVVGNVMHKNPVPFWQLANKIGFDFGSGEETVAFEKENNFPPVPCHRVVNSQGKMGANFGLGGPEVQAKMLEAEGIQVIKGKLDLDKYSFNFGDI